jgi:hypothetical protein
VLREELDELGTHVLIEGVSRSVITLRQEQLADCLHVLGLALEGQHVPRREHGADRRLLPAARQLAGEDIQEAAHNKWVSGHYVTSTASAL